MKRNILLGLLSIFFFGIAGFYGFRFFEGKKEYEAGEKVYEELSQYIRIPNIVHASEMYEHAENLDEEMKDETNWPEVDFTELEKINSDVVAWIYIEGTNINYPVVQRTDNNHYLNYLFDGTYNASGSIFLDYRNENDFLDKHSIIYGHHMLNNTMFSELTNYKEQSYYEEHPVCLIMTPEKNYKLELIAGYVSDPDSDAWQMQFASDDEFSTWLENSVSISTFTSAIEPTAQDRVVTLSTCSYEYSDARYVLVGILKGNK